MKNVHQFSMALLMCCVLIGFTSCSDDDPVTPDGPTTSTSEVLSKKVTTAPTMDGAIDASWADCNTLEGKVIVPSAGSDANNPGKDVFEYFVGESADFTMKSMYDDDNVYFLLQWEDNADSKDRQSWFFDGTWQQQNKYPKSQNDRYYEDKFGVMWDINGVTGWESTTCYATCHQGLDIATEGGKSARHYTNGAGELADIWHWKRVRNVDQLDDKHLIYGTGESKGGARQGDTSTGGGYEGNSQTLNNGTDDVSVPMYIIPGETNYYWIYAADLGGLAKKVTAVDGSGVLTLEDGSTIDPANGGFEEGTGNMRVPSVYVAPFEGPRADVTVVHSHTGTGWVCEISRARTTSTPDEDVQFTDITKDYLFGLAIFNNAAIAHQIKTSLTLKFEN